MSETTQPPRRIVHSMGALRLEYKITPIEGRYLLTSPDAGTVSVFSPINIGLVAGQLSGQYISRKSPFVHMFVNGWAAAPGAKQVPDAVVGHHA
jgi:hypothetical protein